MTAKIHETVPCFYELAPENESLPFAVMNNLYVSALDQGDLVPFYVDVWTDEKLSTATEQIESLCDSLRNALNGTIISTEGAFKAHIGFENQQMPTENEFDLCHRRLSFAARIFYTGGN